MAGGSRVDLSGVPVVDNHCHPVHRTQQHTDPLAWRSLFSEAHDRGVRAAHAADGVFGQRLLRAMAELHGVEADEQAVLTARARLSTEALLARLFHDANIDALVVDTGHPPPETTLSAAQLTAASGVGQVSLLRLELLFQDLVATSTTLGELVDALTAGLADVRADGYAGFKSIVGYRTGLDVQRWAGADVRVSFERARAEVAATGSVRLGHKPLLDTLLHVALTAAAAQHLPVQLHVGYGDPDVDLRTASPLALRPLLEEPAYRDVPLVLLHGCWPYFREGAYLAAVYPNAYLDLSYGIPFLSTAEMTSMTRAALGAAPVGKLLYSSDGVGVPELHWLGAHDGRRVLGACLGELVAEGDVSTAWAERAGQRILAESTRALYGVP